ncbi:MAG: metallophosphoesterase [Bacillota bacterium]
MSAFAPAAWIAGGAGVAAAAGAALAWGALEAGRLQIEYLRFHVQREGLALDRRATLPAGAAACRGRQASSSVLERPGRTMRLAHLTDLHLHRRPGRSHRDALRCTEALGAHLAIVTGDFMDRASRPGAPLGYVLELARRVQVAVVWGNHDHERPERLLALWRALEEAGVWVLVNRHVVLESPAGTVRLVGVDTPDLGYDRYTQATDLPPLLHARWDEPSGIWMRGQPDPSQTAGGVGARRPAMEVVAAHTYHVIEHNPSAMDGALVIVGDTHGGQIDLPLLGPVWARWMHHHRFVRGLFRTGRVWLYVNRGVGTIGVPLRLRCPPELAIIDLSAWGSP